MTDYAKCFGDLAAKLREAPVFVTVADDIMRYAEGYCDECYFTDACRFGDGGPCEPEECNGMQGMWVTKAYLEQPLEPTDYGKMLGPLYKRALGPRYMGLWLDIKGPNDISVRFDGGWI